MKEHYSQNTAWPSEGFRVHVLFTRNASTVPSVWAACDSVSASTFPSKRKGQVWDGGTIFSTDNPWYVSWCRLSGDNQTIFPHYAVQSLARPAPLREGRVEKGGALGNTESPPPPRPWVVFFKTGYNFSDPKLCLVAFPTSTRIPLTYAHTFMRK